MRSDDGALGDGASNGLALRTRAVCGTVGIVSAPAAQSSVCEAHSSRNTGCALSSRITSGTSEGNSGTNWRRIWACCRRVACLASATYEITREGVA